MHVVKPGATKVQLPSSTRFLPALLKVGGSGINHCGSLWGVRSVHPTYEVFTRPTHNAHGLRNHNDTPTANTTSNTFVVSAPSIIVELRVFHHRLVCR